MPRKKSDRIAALAMQMPTACCNLCSRVLKRTHLPRLSPHTKYHRLCSSLSAKKPSVQHTQLGLKFGHVFVAHRHPSGVCRDYRSEWDENLVP